MYLLNDITMFYSQIRLRRGLPFSVEIPNETTLKTFRATDKGEELNSYDNIDDSIIWAIITRKIRPLKKEVQNILN